MSKSTATRLIQKVPGVPGRRGQFSSSTKRSLVDVAEDLFAELGYPATSLDQVVAGAEVTKGALYHHFSGKQALFEAVFQRIEDEARDTIQAALQGERDPWLRAQAGLRAYLAVVQHQAYRRIVIQDGPSVLGYERFREHEERSTFATVVGVVVRDVLAAGNWDLDDDMLQTFTSIFFGAMSSAGMTVATSPDPAAAAVRAETAIGFILSGFQAMAEAGAPVPESTQSPT